MRMNRTVSLLLIAGALAGCSSANQTARVQRKPILVDEYSVLDDQKATKPLSDQVLKRKLEDARRHYVQAMRASEHGNATDASRHFESAMAILNDLITYPDIYSNPEFTKLSESLVQDYEEQVTSLDSLDANSSFFVLRDKIFQEVERIPVERKRYPAAEQLATAGQETSTAELQIELTDNTPVQQCITFFTSEKGRKFFTKWLERSGKFFPMYERVLAEEGAPSELKHLSMIESGLSASAVSWAKAVGLWQFIPSTGQMYGLAINWWVDERRDPEKATHAAARYLKDLYNDMGDWHLALASYNCGPGRVKSAIAKANSRNYWDVRQYLPRETQQYVPLYIAATKIAMNPEAYGFTNINYDQPEQFESVPLKGGTDVSTIAQAAGCTPEQIRALNPELLRDKLPQSSEYKLRVPKGTADGLLARLDDIIESQPTPTFITHKVGRSESLQEIAAKYGVSISAITEANSLTSRSKLKSGSTLRIPTSAGADASTDGSAAIASNDSQPEADAPAATAAPAAPAPAASTPGTSHAAAPRRSTRTEPLLADAGSASIAVRRTDAPTAAATPTPSVQRPAYHVVKGRDNLSSVAAKYSIAKTDLAAWNGLAADAKVKNGLKLRLSAPDAPAPMTAAAKPTAARERNLAAGNADGRRASETRNGKRVTTTSTRYETHKVRKGESLTGIAERYGVSVDDLQAWNPKESRRGSVNAGSTLKIYSEAPSKGDARKSSRASKTTPKSYVVRKGDSMAEIANRFGVSVKQLRAANPKLTEKNLRSGAKIRISK